MFLYPTIELQNGRCVSLARGELDHPQIWHVDPVEKAKEFADMGVARIQVTDFDAVAGVGDNAEIIEQIILQAGVSVQVAGGIRTLEQVDAWAEKGAGRVVIGTAAVLHPEIVQQVAKKYPDFVVLAIDAKDGSVMTNGWKTRSAFNPVDFVNAFGATPLAAVLFTDIDSDICDGEVALSHVTELAENSKVPVIASGLIKSVDDISRLKYVRNISGAILGRALFNKSVDLAEALQIAQPEPEEVAEFL